MKEHTNIYGKLSTKFRELAEENGLMEESVIVTGKTLTPREAIGNPDRQDFPLLTGKERLVEAVFRGCKGQAFSDMPGHFSGSIGSILKKKPSDNYERAVFISALNAVCRSLGITEKTVHCKDNEPEECAMELVKHVKTAYGNPKIALVGFQPSMLEQLAGNFEVRNLDLDKDKIGDTRFGVLVEDGVKDRDDVLDWCDVVISTGSTVVNGTLGDYMIGKPVLFYGTTISAAAALLGLDRFCRCST